MSLGHPGRIIVGKTIKFIDSAKASPIEILALNLTTPGIQLFFTDTIAF
jgi:hypothetical protein